VERSRIRSTTRLPSYEIENKGVISGVDACCAQPTVRLWDAASRFRSLEPYTLKCDRLSGHGGRNWDGAKWLNRLLLGGAAFRSKCQVFEDFAAFHDEDNTARGGDIAEGVAVHGDDVRFHAGNNRADFALQA
jgi:hypothetical protein